MSYTADEIKELSSSNLIHTFSDTKILFYQTMAESVIDALELDKTLSGYSDAVNVSVITLIDFYIQNPTGVKEQVKGRVTFKFDNLPSMVKILLEKFAYGSKIETTKFERSGIGLS